MPDPNAKSDYLGEGVHAQFLPSQGQLWLFVERSDNPLAISQTIRIERICLERDVYEALQRFAALCWPEKEPE